MMIKKILVGICVYMFVFGIIYMINIKKTDQLVQLNWGIQSAVANNGHGMDCTHTHSGNPKTTANASQCATDADGTVSR